KVTPAGTKIRHRATDLFGQMLDQQCRASVDLVGGKHAGGSMKPPIDQTRAIAVPQHTNSSLAIGRASKPECDAMMFGQPAIDLNKFADPFAQRGYAVILAAGNKD